MSQDERITQVARQAFGWTELRPGQRTAMDAVVAGRDVLAVMSTGSGKSAIYQVPALLADGPTVVISPLLSLHRDQVASLHDHGLDAVLLNSSLSRPEQEAALDAVVTGSARFVFLAPEQLAKPEVVAALRRARPARVVVDEAHCICSWGHDFRPDYLRLGQAVQQLGRPPVLALTATASPPVRSEIVAQLGLRDPVQVVRGFDRPNLHLDVETARDDEQRREAVVLRALGEVKPGLVYTATRRSAERYAAAMAELGIDAAAYHGGLRAAERDDVHERFLRDELDVVVATSAFGMGIDKPDVRFVLHAEVADSLDSYYQEIGRAGRDGEPALAVLFYREADLGLRSFFASGSVDERDLQRAAVLVAHADEPVSVRELAAELDLTAARTTALVNLLKRVEGLSESDEGLVTGAVEPAEAASLAKEEAEKHRLVERSRVEMMRAYAETTGCRRQLLLAYFGEELPEPCGRCDRCEAGLEGSVVESVDSPYPVSSLVEHQEWGRGVVMQYEGDRILVLFEAVGYRTLLLDTVVDKGLLRYVGAQDSSSD